MQILMKDSTRLYRIWTLLFRIRGTAVNNIRSSVCSSNSNCRNRSVSVFSSTRHHLLAPTTTAPPVVILINVFLIKKSLLLILRNSFTQYTFCSIFVIFLYEKWKFYFYNYMRRLSQHNRDSNCEQWNSLKWLPAKLCVH